MAVPFEHTISIYVWLLATKLAARRKENRNASGEIDYKKIIFAINFMFAPSVKVVGYYISLFLVITVVIDMVSKWTCVYYRTTRYPIDQM